MPLWLIDNWIAHNIRAFSFWLESSKLLNMAQQNQKMSCRRGGSWMVFFTSVNPFMHSQVVLLAKFLITVVAVERFLPAWILSCTLSFYQMNRITSLLNLTSQTELIIWMVNVYMQVNNNLKKKWEQQNLIEISGFFVHYWELSTTGNFC